MRTGIAKSLRLTSLLVPVAALAALPACKQVEEQPPSITQAVTLQPFSQCNDLEQYIKDTAVREMRMQLDSSRPDRWGWWGGWRGGVLADAAAPGAENGSKSASPSAYTTTNVQVKGVDEPDFMKNDGTRIFTLAGRTLYATQSWPPQDMKLRGSLLLEGYPSAMFLDTDRNRVVVLSNIYLPFDGKVGMGSGASDVPGVCYDIDFGWGCGWGANATKITVVDVSDLGNLRAIDETYLPGNYSNARRVGGSVRVVLSDAFRWPAAVKWWPESNDPNFWNDKGAINRAIDELEEANEKIIRAYPIEKWLPAGQHVVGGMKVDLSYSCSDFYAANAPVRLGMVTVATVNLDKPGSAPSRTSILAEPGEIYASKDSLYLASWHWWWWPMVGQQDWFYLHKFDISDPDKARYLASGGVAGHIVDQFSMDEWNGDLRVATTIATRVPDDNNPDNSWGVLRTTNRVTVVREWGGNLVTIGSSEDLAPGERIQSARFALDKGYIVTYLQVDPLFTMDLSNPMQPRRVGSLKVPGFSTYIHPIDATHLLTMGIYIPEQQQTWSERRMQLQIFDVSDFKNPKQTFSQLVGSAYGWSEAAWEHKAFNYFPERKLLAIPFSDYQPSGNGNYWDSFVSDVRVFSVDTQTGITPRGKVTMRDVFIQNNWRDWTWWYSPWIRRSVMASDDAKQDFVYAVSDSGLRVANLAAPEQPLATVVFPVPKGR